MSLPLRLYWLLPGSARSLAASARGYQLRAWRYDSATDRRVAEALERDHWLPEQWRRWQSSRLGDVLSIAANRVPHYRNRGLSTRANAEALESWPVLSKDELRERPEQFLADGAAPGRMYREHTSGTTGKPLRVWWSRSTVRAWYALFEARVRRWNGVARSDRWGMLGGQLVTPVTQTRPPYWVWNRGLRQLYMSSYHISAATAPAYLEALRRHRVTYLYGYPSALDALAQLSLEQGIEAPAMRVAISNAEPLHSHQRERIAAAFSCSARDTYGMAEIACAASECADGSMHLWPEVGFVEILRDDADEPVAPGETGRIVATGLLNGDMPLVRYDTGDRGVLATGVACRCGRRLPMMHSIEGRADDVIVTPDGRRIGRLDPVFKSGFPVREAQIAQTAPDRISIRIVPTAEFREEHAAAITRAAEDRLGPRMRIEIQRVERIPRTSAGKFRAVISELGEPRHA